MSDPGNHILSNSGFAQTPAPRLLLIDITRLGDGTATGELKATLFADWSADAILQIFSAGASDLGVFSAAGERTIAASDQQLLNRLVDQFDPDLILYRPTPTSLSLHEVAMQQIARLPDPLVAWIMDDWPTSLERANAAEAEALGADWRFLLDRSALRLSISDAMSEAFEARYGVDFIAIANGVDPSQWPAPKGRAPDGPLILRYAGSLAADMTLETVRTVAEAVEQLSNEGAAIEFEIKTREFWRRDAAPAFENFRRTRFITTNMPAARYRQWLADAGIALIAYNFDDASKDYIRYSLSNKMPECLASGAPVLAVGPADIATIKAIRDQNCAICVTENSIEAITDALRKLVEAPDLRMQLGRKGRRIAFERYDVRVAREKLRNLLASAAGKKKAEHAPDNRTGKPTDTAKTITALLALHARETPARGHADASQKDAPLYSAIGERLRQRRPRVFLLLQSIRRALARLWPRSR